MEKPKFLDPKTLTKAQLTDPDYAMKQIRKLAKEQNLIITCSQCHHCR